MVHVFAFVGDAVEVAVLAGPAGDVAPVGHQVVVAVHALAASLGPEMAAVRRVRIAGQVQRGQVAGDFADVENAVCVAVGDRKRPPDAMVRAPFVRAILGQDASKPVAEVEGAVGGSKEAFGLGDRFGDLVRTAGPGPARARPGRRFAVGRAGNGDGLGGVDTGAVEFTSQKIDCSPDALCNPVWDPDHDFDCDFSVSPVAFTIPGAAANLWTIAVSAVETSRIDLSGCNHFGGCYFFRSVVLRALRVLRGKMP